MNRMSGRERILDRIRAAILTREQTDHPGAFEGWRPAVRLTSSVQRFAELFESTGGEVEIQATVEDAATWLADFCVSFRGVSVGAGVPDELRPDLAIVPADTADLGVSMAAGAIAETGSLLLDARDGRRTQLLPPTHVVFVREQDVRETFRDALLDSQGDLPSAIGLHSGPSKSADIGRYLVRGVHGPGRVVAVVLGERITDSS